LDEKPLCGEIVNSFFSAIFGDLIRVYKVLPRRLRLKSSILFFTMLFQAMAELGCILMLTQLYMIMGNPGAAKSGFLLRTLFFLFSGLELWLDTPQKIVFLVSLLAVGVVALKNLFNSFNSWETCSLSENISGTISMDIMERYIYCDYSWHLSKESGQLFQGMMWRGSMGMLLTNLLMLHSSIITVFILFTGVYIQAKALSVIVLGTCAFVGLLCYYSVRHKVDRAGAASMAASGAEQQAIIAAMNGIREVLIYRQQPIILERVSRAILDGIGPRAFLGIAPPIPTWVLEIVGFGMISAAVAILAKQGANMDKINATVAIILLTSWRVLPYLNRCVSIMVSIRAVRPQALNCLQLLERLRKETMIRPPEPDPAFRFDKEIRLENVCYRYPGAESDALHRISLTIRKGQTAGLVGLSGAGKSTLAGVLSGLLIPTSGTIYVDGQPMTPERRAAYCKKIGYVAQSPYLFPGTVADNVAFSEWGRPWDEDRVREACRLAAMDFVEKHPYGIHANIGDKGAGLSGGEAQRVAIARALYAKPDIILFDEATSSLDQNNEKAIQETIASLGKKTTLVLIAHRLSTVEICDMVFWIGEGSLVDCGSPDVLLERYTSFMAEEVACSQAASTGHAQTGA
jgi:ATP-binding cassette, subfamily B, bacterial PglK